MKVSTKIKIPDKLKKFLESPTPAIKNTLNEANRKVLSLLQKNIAGEAPKKSDRLSRSIQVDFTKLKVYTNLVYARAVELGHYATPKRGKFLHFVDSGRDVFLKFSRTRKRPYFFLAASKSMKDVIDIYDNAYKRLLESV